jgi:cellulose synthase/poly-beta-1,6-N-acetylglucosamine synthase-like glycosyltransferase
VSAQSLVGALAASGVLYLVIVYAIGGPVLLVRRLALLARQKRLRYRPVQDDTLASSRFTIPVSVLLPTEGEPDAVEAVVDVLSLNYPELEVVVVNDGSRPALAALRERFQLAACEVFYRRSIKTSPIRAIYRSASEPRLLVLDCETDTIGDALNCGLNLARYRYVCCTDRRVRHHRDALVDSMHAAVEDPAVVVGIRTVISPLADGARDPAPAPPSIWGTLGRLAAIRSTLALSGRRRLSLTEGLPGFVVWRRDVLVEVGGFGVDGGSEHAEVTFRMHRHLLRAGQPYRIVHIAEPVGVPAGDRQLAELVAAQQSGREAIGRVLWRHRGILLNPRYGSLGLLDLPRYVFSMLVIPWLELACFAALPLALVLGIFSPLELGLALLAMGLGNGVLINTALLMGGRDVHPAPTLLRLILLGPIQLFVHRPVQLADRLQRLARVAGRPAAAA